MDNISFNENGSAKSVSQLLSENPESLTLTDEQWLLAARVMAVAAGMAYEDETPPDSNVLQSYFNALVVAMEPKVMISAALDLFDVSKYAKEVNDLEEMFSADAQE